MRRLFAAADEFVRTSTWKDIAVLKACLLALGLLAGMKITERYKKGVGLAACMAFVLTYIPLMSKFLKILVKSNPSNE